MEYGYILLQKKILEWEWYKDTNTKTVFIHLLLKANWKDAKWRGIDIKRGQVVTSIRHLSDELNLSERTIRTSLEHLTKSREIDKQTTSKYSVITVLNYDKYQTNDTQNAQKPTNKTTDNTASNRQTNGKQTTTTKEEINNINKPNNNNNLIPPLPPTGEKGEKRVTACSIIESRNLPIEVEAIVKEWVEYKSERRESYKPRGLNSFISELLPYVDEYGIDVVNKVIRKTMGQNYQGVVWEWFKDYKPVNTSSSNNSDIERWVNKNGA